MTASAWIITRAEPGARATAARLAARGVETLVCPLLRIVPVAGADLAPAAEEALAFTSQNGVAAFAAMRTERSATVFAVGDATAAAARAAGFVDVISAAGDGAALAAMIAKAGPAGVLHVAGEDQAGDLSAALQALGVPARRVIAYRAVAATALDGDAERRIRDQQAAGVLFHSPRAARVFAALAPPDLPLARLTAVCISPAAAAVFAPLAKQASFREIKIAETPDEEALLALVNPTAGKA